MATPDKKTALPNDILFLLTFVAGMAGFWISGHASRIALQGVTDPGLHNILGYLVTGGVFGLGMLLVALLVLRRLSKGVFIAAGTAAVLGLITAQIIGRLATGRIHDLTDLGLLTFVLYICFGVIYALSLAVGRRFAS